MPEADWCLFSVIALELDCSKTKLQSLNGSLVDESLPDPGPDAINRFAQIPVLI